MSPKTPFKRVADETIYPENEWVEIVEPRSKKRIYANLATGVCAKQPPDGATVSRTEDFSDHWWELYDQKTSKYYYYNPEQQKTAWTRPNENEKTGNGIPKRVLIIPVSKLQTFRRLSPNELSVERCDASTQTTVSDYVSTGTQTVEDLSLEDAFNGRLKINASPDPAQNVSNSCTHPSNTFRSHLNTRQMSDLSARDRFNKFRGHLLRQSNENSHLPPQIHRKSTSSAKTTVNVSSQRDPSGHDFTNSFEKSGDNSYSGTYFGSSSSSAATAAATVSYQRGRTPLSIQSPNRSLNSRRDDHLSSTSTFTNPSHFNQHANKPQQLSTNNLSHYLVKEARAMGIALISDEELDEDDQDSDDDCVDDETEQHDDFSSHNELDADLNVSQDFGEDSSEGWKSFSDQESPNSVKNSSNCQKSPLHCEPSPSFTYNDLLNDEKNPSSCLSQQLDHRKLVENFKKSRQSSVSGPTDSLGRSNRSDPSTTVQKARIVGDGYFNHGSEVNDKHLRQVSTLSTLPRPHKETKDKIALSKQDNNSEIIDADYDIVEENCGYYSDSESKVQSTQSISRTHLINKGTVNTNLNTNAQSTNNTYFDRSKSTRGSTFSVESFARENLARHPKKGGLLFNRKVKWSRMITWTKSSIKQPMISSVSSSLNADSISSFKLIQQYMGDRKLSMTKKYRRILAEAQEDVIHSKSKSLGRSSSLNTSTTSTASSSGGQAQIPDSLRDELAHDLIVRGCEKSPLRDEIYVQMVRQLTNNPCDDSCRWGLTLMSILFSYFSPSNKFSPFLISFLESHPNQMARDVCLPRLEKRLRQSWMTYCRKPADGKEISIVRLSITKWPQYCGVFGESLEKIMSLQTCSPYLRNFRLPWILTTLGEKLLETGGAETEGIFRCAADHDLLAQLRLEIDCVDFRKITDSKQVKSLLSNVQDPHVIAGLLKLFFRQLAEPVFPVPLYETCLQSGRDGLSACRIFNDRLPNLNKDVIAYLIRLLQMLSTNERVSTTKMDNSNLSMVWAPNLLRVPNQDDLLQTGGSKNGSEWSIMNGNACEDQASISVSTSQSLIFEQTRQEMQFIRSLIIHLDTSFIENVH